MKRVRTKSPLITARTTPMTQKPQVFQESRKRLPRQTIQIRGSVNQQ
jgi:hypothetical protein